MHYTALLFLRHNLYREDFEDGRIGLSTGAFDHTATLIDAKGFFIKGLAVAVLHDDQTSAAVNGLHSCLTKRFVGGAVSRYIIIPHPHNVGAVVARLDAEDVIAQCARIPFADVSGRAARGDQNHR